MQKHRSLYEWKRFNDCRFTDSIVDAPVLDMFGIPVAVHPDESLAALAAERGWSVIGGAKVE